MSPVLSHRRVELLGRAGLVAKGVSYGLVGALALDLALGGGGKATDRQGALASIATHGWGKVLLALLAAGFLAYALWRLASALSPADDDDGAKEWVKRAGYAARAAIYIGLTYSTIHLLAGAGRGKSQDQKAHQAAGTVLGWPGGTWIVGAAGVVVIGAGLYNGYRGVTRKFAKRWQPDSRDDRIRTWGEPVGVAGLLARMVVFCLIGAFALKAAIQYDAKEAIGLDGALQKLAGETYGSVLLGLTAAGLVAYGVYCLVDARLRRL